MQFSSLSRITWSYIPFRDANRWRSLKKLTISFNLYTVPWLFFLKWQMKTEYVCACASDPSPTISERKRVRVRVKLIDNLNEKKLKKQKCVLQTKNADCRVDRFSLHNVHNGTYQHVAFVSPFCISFFPLYFSFDFHFKQSGFSISSHLLQFIFPQKWVTGQQRIRFVSICSIKVPVEHSAWPWFWYYQIT